MERNEIEEKVRSMFIDEFEIDSENIFPGAKLKEDMGIDSLDYVDIVVMVQKLFGVKIVSPKMEKLKTLSQFCNYLEEEINH